MAITLLASACPAVQGPSGFKSLADAAASPPLLLSAATLTPASTVISSKFNKNAQYLEQLARYGPQGVFAVAYGLTISVVSGLTIEVSAGHALMESLIELPAATQATAFDNADSYVWLKQDGTLELINGATTPPSIDAVYLGRVTATSGTVSGTIEYAGRMEIRGNLAIRETADPEMPSDTPAAVSFLTKTLNGTWLWDSESWLRIGGEVAEYGFVSIALSDDNYTLSAAEYRRQIIKCTGTLTGTRNVVLPTVSGAIFLAHNACSGGSLTFKTTSGAGVTIAAGKSQWIYCDGTKYEPAGAPTA